MCVLYTVVLVVLLALGSNTTPTTEECEGLTKTLQPTELEKIFGDWVLVAYVTDSDPFFENITSSHVELYLAPDNTTIVYNERSMSRNCITYYSNTSVSDPMGANLTLQIDADFKEEDGVVSVYNDSGRVSFYQTCPHCLVMLYRGVFEGIPGQYLLTYRKEGKHQDAEELTAGQLTNSKLAECLQLRVQAEFKYDGVSELCPKRRMGEQKPQEA
ncbi:saxitoxin and tetrodotoxin-binding protein 1-like [Polymixia lowei]